eukprot:Nitzschia sp. Nitz4//scaffold78_size91513//86552//89147//NITZ4_004943-RA/size91513-processed-gene-0.78-mRNA-1//1//CDS//3329558172//4767//frame0
MTMGRLEIRLLLGCVSWLCLCSWTCAFTPSTLDKETLIQQGYQFYPRRTSEEDAVIEWGNSAVISVVDASVAMFGPQTSQSALMEVESKPMWASPINGISHRWVERPSDEELVLRPLENADEVDGNLVIMGNTGGLTGVEMARIAQMSGAAALLVANVDEEHPDDIYRLPLQEGENVDDIDIPVAMISLKSANMMSTAIDGSAFPERVRLYAGGDRPFYEDISEQKPTVYLIHNTLSEAETQQLIRSATNKAKLVDREDPLQFTLGLENLPGVQRVMLWRGMLETPKQKELAQRLEHVTGFPPDWMSDWIVDKLDATAEWKQHYQSFPGSFASITVFLSEEGGPLLFPYTKEPAAIYPQRGMAVVHHFVDSNGHPDQRSIHALLPSGLDKPVYIARKYLFMQPQPPSRRIVLPLIALLSGGRLPSVVSTLHDAMVEQFGWDKGPQYFDQACSSFSIPSIPVISHKACVLVDGESPFKAQGEAIASGLQLPLVHDRSDVQTTHILTLVPVDMGGGRTSTHALSLEKNPSMEIQKKKRRPPKAPKSHPLWVDFCPSSNSFLGKRCRHQSGKDLLVTAVAPKKDGGLIVHDFTAGLGQDSLLLASSGARQVVMVERNPIVVALLQDGLRRLHLATEDHNDGMSHKLHPKLALISGDAKEIVQQWNETQPEVVYLDPMFPPRSKAAKVSKGMDLLHSLLDSQEDYETDQDEQLLEAALRHTRHKVVVKRPQTVPPLGQSHYRPSYSVEGSSNRWDVYVKSG